MGKLTAEDKRSNTVLHSALCFGLVAIAAVMYYLVSTGSSEMKYDPKSMFFIIGSVGVLLSLLISSKVYTTNINNAQNREFESYEAASANFRAANIARWSLVQGACMIALVLAFLDYNVLLFFPPVIGIVYLLVSKLNEEHFEGYRY